MSFTATRDSQTLKITKVARGDVGDINSNAEARPVTAARPSSGDLNSVTIDGVTLSPELVTKLAKLPDQSGVAQANRMLVADASVSLTGLGTVRCDSLWLGSNLYDPQAQPVTGEIDDESSPFLTTADITPGAAVGGKAVVLDNNLSVKGINSISVSRLLLGGACIVVDRGTTCVSTNAMYTDLYHRKDTRYRIERSLAAGNAVTTTLMRQTSTPMISDAAFNVVIFSEELGIYVAMATSGVLSSSTLLWSRNGFTWNIGTNITASNGQHLANSGISFMCMGYSPDLVRFVAYSQASGRFFTWYSDDGMSWTLVTATGLNNLTYYAICWSRERSEFLMVGNFGTARSSDGITWTALGGTATSLLGGNGGVGCIYHPPSRCYISVTNNSEDYSHLAKSVDGVSWTFIPTTPGNGAACVGSIAYSPELNIIVAGTVNGGTTPNKYFIYSKDGGMTWLHATCANNNVVNRVHWIVWVGSLRAFLSGNEAGAVGWSYDGMAWHFGVTGTGITSVFWNRKTAALVGKDSTGEARWKSFQLSHMTGTASSLAFNQRGRALGIGGPAVAGTNLAIYSNPVSKGLLRMRSSGNFVVSEVVGTETGFSVRGPVISINTNATSLLHLGSSSEAISAYNLHVADVLCVNSSPANTAPLSLAVVNSAAELESSHVLSCNALSGVATPNNHALLDGSVAGKATPGKLLVHRNGDLEVSDLQATELVSEDAVFTGEGKPREVPVGAIESLENMHESVFPHLTALADSGSLVVKVVPTGASLAASTRVFFVPDMNKVVLYDITTTQMFISAGELSLPNVAFVPKSMPVISRVAYVEYIPEARRLYISMPSGLMYTTNLSTFKYCNMDQSGQVNSIAYSPTLRVYVASMSSVGFLISTNGIDWSMHPDTSVVSSSLGTASIKWSPVLDMFVAVSANLLPLYSYNGYRWSTTDSRDQFTHNSESDSLAPRSLAQSSKTGLLVYNTARSIYYSRDGKVYYPAYVIPIAQGNTLGFLEYIEDLDVFVCTVATSSAGGTFMAMSKNGTDWFGFPIGLANSAFGAEKAFNCRPTYNQVTRSIMFTGTTTAALFSIDATKLNLKNFSWADSLLDSGLFQVDNVNGRLGIGTTPQYSLELSRDSAYKPATATWTTSSDARLKQAIQPADVSACLQVVESVPLRHYRWLDEVYTGDQVNDRSQLGWIAQEVQPVLPGSVTTAPVHLNKVPGEDCLQLNTDQLIASMYGALQRLMQIDEDLDQYFV